MQNIKMVSCGVPGCKNNITFDLNIVRKPLTNKIRCGKCGKEWLANLSTSCCYINIKFVSVESGSRKPIIFIKTFSK
jgi:hypothetical protein